MRILRWLAPVASIAACFSSWPRPVPRHRGTGARSASARRPRTSTAECNALVVTDSKGTPNATTAPTGLSPAAVPYRVPAARPRRRMRRRSPSSTPTTTRPRRPTSPRTAPSSAFPPARRRTAASRRSARTAARPAARRRRVGPRDLARRPGRTRDLSELQDPARRGQLVPLHRPRAPRRTRAAAHGATVISNSLRRRRVLERDAPTTPHFNHPGIAITVVLRGQRLRRPVPGRVART